MQHHINIPQPAARFILLQGRWLVSIVLMITLLAAWQIYRTPLSISALESFTSDLKTFEDYQARAKLFGGDSDMLVFVATDEGEQLFTPRVLNAIRAASQELLQLPEVEQVVCLTDVPLMADRPRTTLEQAFIETARKQVNAGQVPFLARAISIEPWWPRTGSNQASIDLPLMRQTLMQDKLIYRRLLSADGNSQCMMIRLKPNAMGLSAKWKIRARIVDTLKKYDLGRRQLHVSGLTVSESWILDELVSCLKYQLPLGVLIIGFIVFSMYRSLSIAV